MHNKNLVRVSDANLFLSFITLFAFTARSSYAQKYSTVAGLAFNGKSANSAQVKIFEPGGGNKTEVSIGDRLVSGVKMIIPPNTIVMLQSPGGRQVVKPTSPGKPMEYKIEFNASGENHVVKGVGAQIVNTVNKTLGYNYRNTNEKGTTAASRGTVFTFTDLSGSNNEKAKIATTEGTIGITDEVPVKVNGKPVKNNRHGGSTTKSVSTIQSANDNEFTSSDEAIDYANYDAIVNDILKEIKSEEVDREDLADDLMCLGDIYMDMEQPEQAVKPYSDAVSYYESEYGDDDLSTIEANLSLADAHKGSGKDAQASAIASKCIELLLENLNLAEEDFDFSKEDNDAEGQELICEEISEICDFLGWAYEIAGDLSKSEEYYTKAEAGCR